MGRNTRFPYRVLAVALAVMIALLAIVPAQAASNPALIPPQAKVEGLTYGQWSARWWQWLYSIAPWANSPVNDATGANCAQGQSGQVWFLAETWVPDSATGLFDVTRNCTIPAGKMLFIPMLNAENSRAEAVLGYPQFDGTWAGGPNSLVGLTSAGMTAATRARLTVDGRVFDALANPALRVQAGLVEATAPSYTLGPGNILGLAPGSYKFFADGYFAMLAPLSAGDHTLVIEGATTFPGTFQTVVTYHLHVAAGR